MRPAIVEVLRSSGKRSTGSFSDPPHPLPAAQLGDAVLAAQPLQHDADLLLGGVLPPPRTADVSDDLLGRLFQLSVRQENSLPDSFLSFLTSCLISTPWRLR